MDIKKFTPGRYPDFWMDFSDVSLESLGGHVMFGEVNEERMKEAATFILKANHIFEEREITLFLNTLGGSCTDGFALIDLMEISKLPIRTIGIGSIMSMGVLILSAGTRGKRILTRNTTVMAHQFSDEMSGKFHEITSSYKSGLMMRRQFIEHFKRHTSMDERLIKEVMFGKSDEYLTPTECKRYGLCDHVVDELPEFNLELPVLRARRRPRPPSARSKHPALGRIEGTGEQKKR